ncbi:MAG: lasso peptide biosynthesis B2 protein [Actinomycetia bacterium]|nr:lasso peptide biosynthesis B2 protein [Actinomycetes bacterium]
MIGFFRRIRAFKRRPWRDRIAWAESTALFWWFTVALKLVRFRRFKRLLGPSGEKDIPWEREPSGPLPDDARIVALWLRRIARKREDTCLAQALAGRVMMRRRRLPSTVSFGVREAADGDLKFHAWLVHDDWVLTGGGALRSFSVIATFYDDPKRRR